MENANPVYIRFGLKPKHLHVLNWLCVTAYPLITKALVDKGYSKADIHKILGGNLLRVLKANEVQP